MRIVVGISGGIAAYKAVGVVRGLVREGHEVRVIATEAALRFVGRPTLEAISRNPVETELFDGVAEVRHVAIGQQAELIVIAPATANTLAKLAAGLADDLLGTTVLASDAPLVVAPAMHTQMWENPATRANVAKLQARGVSFVGPAEGRLTGEDSGLGRMAEPEDIIAAALSLASPGDLAGLRVLVTAGGTREPIDPVRFIGNRSSGRQGTEIAVAAARRGADVILVAANLDVTAPAGVTTTSVSTAEELRETTLGLAPEADVVVMAAAVADYRPVEVSEHKLKKDAIGDELELRLVRNPDILREIVDARAPGQLVVGFAAETVTDLADQIELGRAKIARKGADLLVLNRVGWSEGFHAETNTVVIIDRDGEVIAEASGSKASVADRILDSVADAVAPPS